MYELLENGSEAADSGAMTVVAGTPVTVAITYSPDSLPREASLGVLLETVPAAGEALAKHVSVGRLSHKSPSLLLVAPGRYIVRREDLVAREITVLLGAVTSDTSFSSQE